MLKFVLAGLGGIGLVLSLLIGLVKLFAPDYANNNLGGQNLYTEISVFSFSLIFLALGKILEQTQTPSKSSDD